jgi:hypothetical protein
MEITDAEVTREVSDFMQEEFKHAIARIGNLAS